MPKPKRIECDCGSRMPLIRTSSGLQCEACISKEPKINDRHQAMEANKTRHLDIFDFGICHYIFDQKKNPYK